MITVLFLCTGNYYRSRFAEIFFNHLAEQHGSSHRAESRGLEAWAGRNPGPLSRHVIAYLKELDISWPEPHRFPLQMEATDWALAEQVIALDEEEHRPMILRDFPAFEHRVAYWQFQDTHLADPALILPAIREKVLQLLAEI